MPKELKIDFCEWKKIAAYVDMFCVTKTQWLPQKGNIFYHVIVIKLVLPDEPEMAKVLLEEINHWFTHRNL